MSSTTRVLIGLFAGLGAGLTLRAVATSATVAAVLAWIEPVGMLWLNAMRMTVVPLVVSLLVTGVAAASDVAASGRVAARAVSVIVVMLAAGAALSAIVSPTAFAIFPSDATAAATLRGSSTQPVAAAPPLSQWITGIIPANPIQSAAEGAMLPLVVFALALGFAATRIAPQRRERLVGFFEALRDAMMVIVHAVLRVAPLGVFALVLPIVARGGFGIVGALGSYILVQCALIVVQIVAMYPLASIAGGVGIRRFARAAAPAQAVAASTQSSLASLPAMLEGAAAHLKFSPSITGLVLPLAVSLFRITSPLGYMVGAAFVARLYGIPLSPTQYAAGIAVGVVMSMGAVSLPGQVSYMASHIPVYQVMGLPLGPLAMLMAVDTIPDIFGTVGNVTADLALTTIVARQTSEDRPAPVAAPPAAAVR